MTITATKLFPSGATEVCAVVSGRLVRRTFYGYSKRQSIALFRQSIIR